MQASTCKEQPPSMHLYVSMFLYVKEHILWHNMETYEHTKHMCRYIYMICSYVQRNFLLETRFLVQTLSSKLDIQKDFLGKIISRMKLEKLCMCCFSIQPCIKEILVLRTECSVLDFPRGFSSRHWPHLQWLHFSKTQIPSIHALEPVPTFSLLPPCRHCIWDAIEGAGLLYTQHHHHLGPFLRSAVTRYKTEP